MCSFVNFGLKMKICIMLKCSTDRIPSLWSDPGTSMPGVPGGVPGPWNAPPERPTGVEGPGASFPGVPRSVPRPWNGIFLLQICRPAETGQGEDFKECGVPRRFLPKAQTQISIFKPKLTKEHIGFATIYRGRGFMTEGQVCSQSAGGGAS